MSNPIQPIAKDYLGGANSLVLDNTFSFIPDCQLLLLQTINKHWKSQCWAYFGREASKMTEAGFPMKAEVTRIHSMEELVKKIRQCTSLLSMGKYGIFTCSFPFDDRKPLVIAEKNPLSPEQYDVVANCVAASKGIKGIIPKFTTTLKNGITKEISFCETISGGGTIPSLDLPMDEISKSYVKLEGLMTYLSSRLIEILGQDLGEQIERIKSKIVDKLPKHVTLGRQYALVLQKVVPLIEQNKVQFNQILNDSTGLLQQIVDTPAVNASLRDSLDATEAAVDEAELIEQAKLTEAPGFAAYYLAIQLKAIEPLVDPTLYEQLKTLLTEKGAHLKSLFEAQFGMTNPSALSSSIVTEINAILYQFTCSHNTALNRPDEKKE